MASSSTSYEIGNNYSQFDIFINHRGPDCKKGLASHLYHSLRRQGLRPFLDFEELEKGDNLSPQIEGAIKTASLHIAIFSPRYAESSWCLDELVLMLKSRKTILPVFYNVKPSELRWKQRGEGYDRALRMLEEKTTLDSQIKKRKRYEPHTIEEWRKALSDVSYISGFELDAYGGDEGQLVQKIVEQARKKVGKPLLNVAKHPTGLDDKAKDVEKIVLSEQQNGKQATVVGIVGPGGVGKTTLAKEFFNRHRSDYDRSCFLYDVRENAAKDALHVLQSTLIRELAQYDDVHISNTDEGIEKLKTDLLPSHRALVVLDDVDDSRQLDALFSPIKHTIHSCSLILITSRDRDLLETAGILESFIYKLKGLNQQHSRELFCLHAFNNPFPGIEYKQMVEKFLGVCDGLPLSLRVIGALLCNKKLEYWKAQFDKISMIPPKEILNTLKISYDSLEDYEQQIFVDSACFFIGEDRDTTIRIWEGSGWHGWLGLRNLENKCLLEVDSENRIRMHDHLRDMGRGIAKNKAPHRLWGPADILSDQSSVRGVSMVHGNGREQSFKIPTNMRDMQLLRAKGDRVERIVRVAQPQLVWLCWYSCPFPSLPSWIPVENLRVLYIQAKKLETLWQHESQAPLQLRELNIDADLLNVPKSIGMLKHLEIFALRNDGPYAVNLDTLPEEIGGLHSLKHLELHKCKNIKLLPHSSGNWTSLQYLSLNRLTLLEALPDSAGNWANLQSIGLGWCSALQELPDSAGNWANLQSIDLGWCSALQALPDSAGNWANLQSIDLGGCFALQALPDSAGNWANLQSIGLGGCSALQALPDSAGNWANLQSISLSACSALQALPDSAGNWANLQSICLGGCFALQALPDSTGNWANLQSIGLGGCSALQALPDSAWNWVNLHSIDLRGCSALQVLPDSAGNWANLQSIDLRWCFALQGLPDSAGNWANLQSIDLNGCSALQALPDSAGNWANLQSIDLRSCSALQALPDSAGNWANLQSIDLRGCSKLQALPDSAGNWANLQSIDLRRCSKLQALPDSAGNWANLQSIDLRGCSELQCAGEVLDLLRRRLKSELLI